MNKEIKVVLDQNNEIELACENIKHKVENNSITSYDIYKILDYENGNKYTVELVVEGKRTEIVDPIKKMLDEIVEEINNIQSPAELMEEDLAEFKAGDMKTED